FLQWAQFERGGPPDAVFSFQSCDECEAQRFLASFSLDLRRRAWKVRAWPHDEQNILIEEQGEPDEGMSTVCAYGVGDYTNDGLDDVATWCRTRYVNGNKFSDVVSVYTITTAGSEKIVWRGARAR